MYVDIVITNILILINIFFFHHSPTLGMVGEWCDLLGMKLNLSKTNTMIISRSCTMHPQSPPLTIGGTVLKESDDLVIFGVTFDSKMTFEKQLRSVSRAACQKLGVLRKFVY